MSEFDFSVRPETCPSELELDRLEMGEFESKQAEKLQTHVDGCESCRSVIAARTDMAAQFKMADREAMLANIMGGLDQSETAKNSDEKSFGAWLAGWLRLPPVRTFAVAGAAMAAGLMFLYQGPPEPTGEEIRTKGIEQPSLTVYRERAGQVVELDHDDVVKTGDRLRFGVRIPQARGQFMIIGVEASGEHFVYYPADSGRSLAIASVDERKALDATVELDESKGREHIHLVWCPDAFGLETIKTKSARHELKLPVRCQSTGIEVLKE